MTDFPDTPAIADTQPVAEFFDIAAVLDGRSYPEVDVPFYLDESAGLALFQANKRLTELALLGRQEDHDLLEGKIAELKKQLAQTRYVITLRGLPVKMRQDLLSDAFTKYPRTSTGIDAALGIDEPSDERDQYFSTKLMQAMAVKIVAPNGAIQVAPSIETIQKLRDYAPQAALAVINEGMNELTDGVKAGFESAVQDTDFLSQR